MGNTFGKIPSPSTPAPCWKPSRWWRRRASASRCTPKRTRSWNGARSGWWRAGRHDPLAHIASRPAVVAVEAVSRAAILAEWTGARIHILHISSAEELRPLREAKARGVDITGETGPHYLMLSTDDYEALGGIIARQSAGARAAQPGAAVGGASRRHDRHDRHRPRPAHARGKNPQRHLGGRLRLSRRRDADAADAHRRERRPSIDHRLCAPERRQPGQNLGPLSAQGRARNPAPTPISPSSIFYASTPSTTRRCSRARKSRRGTAGVSKACRCTLWCAAALS